MTVSLIRDIDTNSASLYHAEGREGREGKGREAREGMGVWVC